MIERNRREHVPLALGLLLALSATGASSTAGEPVREQTVRLNALVNEERARAGCGPVEIDAILTAATQEHSEDMVAQSYFSDRNTEQEKSGDRARRHGYPKEGAVAESIARGQQSPEDVAASWMNSDSHRGIIENCKWTAAGVGIAEQVWTQKLGSVHSPP